MILSVGYHEPPELTGWPGHAVPGPCWRFARGFAELGRQVLPANTKWKPRGSVTDRHLEMCDLCWVAGQQFRWWEDADVWLPKIAERMPVMVNYCDIRDEPERWFEYVAEYATIIFHAAGGWCLERLLEAGFARAAFLPGPPYDWGELTPERGRDIGWFFSGSETPLGNGDRDRDLAALVETAGYSKIVVPGMLGTRHIAGKAHAELMWRARRGLCVSHFHDRPKYTSQRTWAYMLSAIDVACRRFEGCEEMLPPEACVYSSTEELAELALEPRDEERAQALRRFVLDNYMPKRLAEVALAYVSHTDPGVSWAEVIER